MIQQIFLSKANTISGIFIAGFLLLTFCQTETGIKEICAIVLESQQAVNAIQKDAPEIVLETSGMAMNQLDDFESPIGSNARGIMASGLCGKAGIILRDPGSLSNSGRLLFREMSVENVSLEEVDSTLLLQSLDASLFYDEDCRPVIVRFVGGAGLVEYIRADDGVWQKGSPVPLAAVLGSEPASVSVQAAILGQDGLFHLILMIGSFTSSQMVLASRQLVASGTWELTVFSPPTASEILAWQVGSDRSVHALFKTTEYPCDPCNLDLYYGRFSSGGSWATETVQTSQWGNPDDEYAAEPAMVLNAQNEPIITAQYVRRVVTGSLKSSELRLYVRSGGSWCIEIVAAAVDGYQGSDGPQFTGVSSQLVLDSLGRLHVVFSDISEWHDGNGYANGVYGQLRYAIRSDQKWTFATLFEQPGQTVVPKPLHGFRTPSLTVSTDGSRVYAAGVADQWETDSIYNNTDLPIAYQAIIVPLGLE